MLAIAAAAGLAWMTADSAARYFETRLQRDAVLALEERGFDWAGVETDGTRIHVSGIAPDEVARFRALQTVTGATEGGRVVDDMQVAALAQIARPEFEVELLRNDDGISIIGLVPAGLNREAVVKRLQDGTGAQNVSDLLETADYEVPHHWDEAFAFGLRVAQLSPRAKVSIGAGKVTVTALTDSRDERIALEEALRRNRPENVALTTNITAPRPVISPFTLRFVMDGEGARFDACAADAEAARDDILAAGTRAGTTTRAACQLGLGAPSRDWGRAAVLGVDAVAALGAGSVTLSDTEVALQVPATVPSAQFDETVARLQAALPAPFSLAARQEADSEAGQGAAGFTAATSGTGQVVMRGRIADARMRDAVESFARSRFGQTDSALRLDGSVPNGWTVSVIAGLEAMAGLANGTVTVTPELIRVTGISGHENASDMAAMQLAARLGAGANYELAIRYDRRLDPLLDLPSGEECVDRLNTVMRESLIGFEPGKSVIAGDPAPTLEKLAEAIGNCDEYRIEIGGHTDSQGSDSSNAQLSQRRAQAVLEAMAGAGIHTRLIGSRGYGESEPIADNDTEAGREANRRIEFRLLDSRPVALTPVAPTETVTGTTTEEQAEEARAGDGRTTAPAVDAATVAATVVSGIVQPGTGVPTGEVAPLIRIGVAEGLALLPDEAVTPVNDSREAFATMAATLIVHELTLSPELAIDTAEEMGEDPGGESGDPAPDTGAENPGPVAPGSDDRQVVTAAATVGLAVIGLEIPVLTRDATTPRPSRRPDSETDP